MADRETGLSPERLSVLSVLVFAGPRSVGALAEAEGVSAPAISRIVSSLEATGFASRERSKGDAREVRVSATAKARRLVERGRKRRLEIIASELQKLDRRDIGVLADVAAILGRLGAAAKWAS